MTLPDGYRLTDVPESRSDELEKVTTWAFPDTLTAEQLAELPWPLDFSRSRGVETDDGELVAVHASYLFARHPVPGTTTAVSGLTWVGVHPGHRRRGLLSAMIGEHFTRSVARGEAISALWASEASIYQRFGYGMASRALSLTVPRGAALHDVPGWREVRIRVEEFDGLRHTELVSALHAAVPRPGWTTWETPELTAAVTNDPVFRRHGFESQRILVAERDGVPVGYARFRRKSSSDSPNPQGTVRLRDLVAADPAATRALWGVLVDLDLMAKVEAWPLPTDDPVTHLLVDYRGAEPRLGDNLWVRLLDVGAALAARRYAAPVDVVLEITDDALPTNTGRWHLVGGPDGAEAVATDAPAQLALDVRELGAAYLGGTSLAALATAGLVTELEAGSLYPAAAAFGWPLAPVCTWVW